MALAQSIARTTTPPSVSIREAVFEFKSGLALAIKLLTTRYNTRVLFQGVNACTDGNTIMLPDVELLIRNKATEDDVVEVRRLLMALRGYAWHEASHVMETDIELFKQASEFNKSFHCLLNSLEDIRIEHRTGSQYPGVKQSCSFLRHKWVWPDMVDGMVEKEGTEEAASSFTWFCLALQIMADQEGRHEEHFAWGVIPEGVRNYAELFKKECYEVLAAHRLPKDQGTAKVYDICERIWSALEDDYKSTTPENTEKDEPDTVYVDMGCKAEEGEESVRGFKVVPNSDGSLVGKDKIMKLINPEDLKGEDSDLEKLISLLTKIESEVEEAVDELRKEIEDEPDMRPYLVYSREHDVLYKPRPTGAELCRAREKLKILKDATHSVYGPVKRRLEHLLRVQSRSFVAGDRLEGTELDSSNLYQLALTKKIPKYEPRIFQEKIERFTLKDTAVGLMVDSSGSMYGRKAELAKQTVFALGECLAAAKVRFGMWSFTTKDYETGNHRFSEASKEEQTLYSRWGDSHLTVAKDFNDKWEAVRHNTCTMFDQMYHNLDSEAVLFAGQQLLAQRQKRKVLFVLSDGDPCCGSDSHTEHLTPQYVQGRQDKHLVEVVTALRAQGVEVVGIGICTSSVDMFYKPAAVVVHDMSDLPKVVLEQMKFLLLQERN